MTVEEIKNKYLDLLDDKLDGYDSIGNSWSKIEECVDLMIEEIVKEVSK